MARYCDSSEIRISFPHLLITIVAMIFVGFWMAGGFEDADTSFLSSMGTGVMETVFTGYALLLIVFAEYTVLKWWDEEII